MQYSGEICVYYIDRDPKIAAFVDSNKERAKELSLQYGGAVYASLDDALKNETFDAVTVATPSGLHGEAVIKAASYGKHSIVEKPIDVSIDAAKNMIRECRKNNVYLSCILQHRFDSSTRIVRQMMNDGLLGQLIFIHASLNINRPREYYKNSEWRGTFELDGGGVLMNQAIHYVDLLYHLGGEVEDVFSIQANLSHDYLAVEDVVSATLRFRNGAIGTLNATTSAPTKIGSRMEIVCENGYCVIEDHQLVRLSLYDTEKNPIKTSLSNHNVEEPSSHHLQFQDFFTSILNRREPLVTGEEGMVSLHLVHHIYSSAHTNQMVSLKENCI